MAQSCIVCLTIFSSLCLNGNSAVGIVSSTSILDIKTAMTQKKDGPSKLWRFLFNSLQFGVPLNGLLTYLNLLLLKIMCLCPWLWSRQRRLLETWILFLKSQHGIRTWHICTEEPPSQTYIISDIHPSQGPFETRWCSRVYVCGHLGALRLHSNIKENANLWDLCLNPGMACVPAGWQDRSRSETDWHLKPGCLEDGWKSSPRHRDCTWTLCSSAPTFFCRSAGYGSWL